VGQRVKVKRPSQACTLKETLNPNNASKTIGDVQSLKKQMSKYLF
jgi:hypothetical protein